MAEHGVKIFNSEGISKSEIPSAGAKCNARGLAKLAAVMANGGELGGKALMSNNAWQQIHANPINRKMTLLNSAFTQGGLAQFEDDGTAPKSLAAALNAGREGFFGWMGYGGSVFQWHPELGIGFAYVPTALNTLDFFNQRGKSYQQQTVQCVRGLSA
jgi:CubicO group peptidase (beta-lactamase class C family)